MIIGVPRDTNRHEHRVGLTPFAVTQLTGRGHQVLIEKGAGESAHFRDQDYQAAGAQIVYSSEEAYKRADLVCRVSVLNPDELDFIKPGSVICGFQHLAVASRELAQRLMKLEVSLVGYEIIRDKMWKLPVLIPLSEMAGQMSVHLAAHYLQIESGGRGVLIGNVPGVPPPTVLILGAGTVGQAAARQALASGAHVIILDADMIKLRALHNEFRGQVVTVVPGTERLEKYTAIADVLIGAILIPGGRAPFLITENMVKSMKPGSVIIDVAIDQGGCVETSRPTPLDNPTFIAHDVVHYCVPNITANLARTASRALASAAIPYLTLLADKGIDAALRDDPGLGEGVYLYRGKMVNQLASQTLGFPSSPLKQLMEESQGS